MKAILMSIKPKWCELIFSGEKTVEVRKTAPKLKPPFKVYVYQTKYRLCNKFINEVLNTVYDGCKVIGEFVCNKEEDYYANERGWYGYPHEETCLRCAEIARYGRGKTLHGLHITAPKLYDTPKALSEFRKPDEPFHTVEINENGNVVFCDGYIDGEPITRPPQSWMYVEEIEE